MTTEESFLCCSEVFDIIDVQLASGDEEEEDVQEGGPKMAIAGSSAGNDSDSGQYVLVLTGCVRTFT